MDNFIQKVETVGFIKAYTELKSTGVFKTDAELCRSIKYAYSNLRQVLTGYRNIPLKVVYTFCDVYGLNLEYFTKGEDELFLVNSLNEPQPFYNIKVDKLEEQLKEKDERIKDLQVFRDHLLSQVEEMRQELERLKQPQQASKEVKAKQTTK
jgi:hypothetical protein